MYWKQFLSILVSTIDDLWALRLVIYPLMLRVDVLCLDSRFSFTSGFWVNLLHSCFRTRLDLFRQVWSKGQTDFPPCTPIVNDHRAVWNLSTVAVRSYSEHS